MINAPFHHIIAELEWNPSNKLFKMIFLKKKKIKYVSRMNLFLTSMSDEKYKFLFGQWKKQKN